MRKPPKCISPVGEGAKRTRTLFFPKTGIGNGKRENDHGVQDPFDALWFANEAPQPLKSGSAHEYGRALGSAPDKLERAAATHEQADNGERRAVLVDPLFLLGVAQSDETTSGSVACNSFAILS